MRKHFSTLMQHMRDHSRKNERGFTLMEVMVTIGVTAVVMGAIVIAIMTAGKSTNDFSTNASAQTSLTNSVATISRVLSASPRITYADDYRMDVEDNSGNRMRYLYHDPANPSVNLGEGLEGVAADSVPTMSSPSLVEVKLLAGSDVSTVTVMASDVSLNQGDSGLPLFAYYNEKDAMLTTRVAEVELSTIRRVGLKIASMTDARDESLEIATSIKIGGADVAPGDPTSPGLTPPGAPILAGTLPPPSRVSTLTWNQPAGATSYALYRYDVASGAGTATVIKTVASDVTPDISTSGLLPVEELASGGQGLEWGHTYGYYVTASGPGGTSARSNTVELTVVPESPEFINVDEDAAGAGYTVARGLTNHLTWTPRYGATGYRLYRGNSVTGTLLQNSTATSFADTGRAYGDSTLYTVVAYNSGMNGSGGDSAGQDSITLISPPVDPTISGSHSNGDRFLWWTASPNARTYPLTRATATTSTSAYTTATQLIEPTSPYASSSRYTDDTAVTAWGFRYQVLACNAAGCSPGNAVTTIVLNPNPAAPELNGTHSNGSRILSWSSASNATRYRLERTAPSAVLDTLLSESNPAVTTVTDSTGAFTTSGATISGNSAFNAAQFTYRLRAWNKTGFSPIRADGRSSVSINPRPPTPTLTCEDFTTSCGGLASNQSDGRNRATVGQTTNATFYQFLVSETRNGAATTYTTTTRTRQDNPSADSWWWYRATACNIVGCSDASVRRDAKQPPGDFDTYLTQVKMGGQGSTSADPNSQAGISYTDPEARLTWDASSGNDGWRVYQGNGTLLYSNNGSGASVRRFTDTDFTPGDTRHYDVTAIGGTSGIDRVVRYSARFSPSTYKLLLIQPTAATNSSSTITTTSMSSSVCSLMTDGKTDTATNACAVNSNSSWNPKLKAGNNASDYIYQKRDYIVDGTGWAGAQVRLSGSWGNYAGGRAYSSNNYSPSNRTSSPGNAGPNNWKGNLNLFRVQGSVNGTGGFQYGTVLTDNDFGGQSGPKGNSAFNQNDQPRASWGQYMTFRMTSPTVSVVPRSVNNGTFWVLSSPIPYAGAGHNYEGVCALAKNDDNTGSVCRGFGNDNN